MIKRLWLFILLCAFIPLFAFAGEWDDAYIDSLYSGRYLEPIEGVWKFPRGGAKIAVVKSRPNSFDIYLIDSPKLNVKPGTLIGSAVVTPKRNYYDGELKSSSLGKKDKLKSQTVTFTVNDNGTLSIVPYKTGYSLSLKRWLSYLSKITVIDHSNSRPKDLDGAIRVYPYIITEHLPVCL